MTVLTTQRLILREMASTDLDDIAALLGDEYVMRYYPRPKTRGEAQGWIGWNQQLYRDHGFGLWAVELRSTGEFVGDCGLTLQRVDDTEEIEVGYHVRASLQGNGYATEAASAARDFARDRLSLHRLIAIINPANLPSQGVARKIGLKPEKHSTVHGRECVIYAGELQSPAASDDVAPPSSTAPQQTHGNQNLVPPTGTSGPRLDAAARPRLPGAALRAKVVRGRVSRVCLRSVTAIAPRGGLGVDRGVDRRPKKSQCHVCSRSTNARHRCTSSSCCEQACFL